MKTEAFCILFFKNVCYPICISTNKVTKYYIDLCSNCSVELYQYIIKEIQQSRSPVSFDNYFEKTPILFRLKNDVNSENAIAMPS